MLSSAWGWVHAQVRPRLRNSLRRAERRIRALHKLMSVRYGPDLSKLDFVSRIRAHDKWRGYHPRLSWWLKILLSYQEKRIRRRLTKYDLATDEQKETWRQQSLDKTRVRRLVVGSISEAIAVVVRKASLWLADHVTTYAFEGKGAGLLFGAGFILWNSAKVILVIVTK